VPRRETLGRLGPGTHDHVPARGGAEESSSASRIQPSFEKRDCMDLISKSAAGLYFRKSIRKELEPVSLDADMIRLLLAIDEGKSLYQIAAEVEMDAVTFKKNLKKLLEQGLIETVQKAAALVERHFLQSLRMSLTRIIGPMADIVVDDSVAELKLDAAGISVEQAAELINRIALEIPTEDSRMRFKKSMIPILNKVKP
jgi:DNA-binding MarR family transcriptional regulator